MCGIFAVLSRHSPITRDFGGALTSLRHRGPDDCGRTIVNLDARAAQPQARAWLGHLRLSILDLTDRGRQPMASDDERFQIIFNGEIYNYVELRDECRCAGAKFRTGTDTEVLLKAWQLWGQSCLTRLKGMFAFVIVDRHAGTATLVRDFFGIKPLFYSVTDGAVAISSEPLPLVENGFASVDVDPEIAYEYVRFGSPRLGDRTLLRDVQSLPAAHIAVFDFASGALSEPRTYWSLRPTAHDFISFPDAVAECRERFLENVRLHLRSDVPVGAALSGGIDSSSIVCAMRRLEPELDLQTFSYIASDPRISEERWVDVVHQTVGGIAHKIRGDGVELSDRLELLVRRQGEPFGGAGVLAQFLVFERARQEGVPVTLDGQGSDELLAGYLPYVATRAAPLIRRGNVFAAAALLRHAAPNLRGRLFTAGLCLQGMLPPTLRSIARSAAGREFAPTYLDREWLRDNDVSWLASADALVGRYATLREHLIDTVERGSLPTLLRYTDRNSMAFSIESRVPFLTHDFAQFIVSLPAEYLISPTGERKYVFREAMKGILPESIRQRRDKIGFAADEGRWLRALHHRFDHVWSALETLPMFDAPRLRSFLDDFFAGRHERSPLVWRLLVYGLWHQELQRARSIAIAAAA